MRVFIALSLDKEIREGLGQTISRYQDNFPGIKWVPAENLHLTLKFLGEINRFDLHQVISALERISTGFCPFPMAVQGAGFFPAVGSPQIFWAGIKADRELSDLAKAVTREIPGGDSKKFHPHITLGRIRGNSSLAGDLARLFLEDAPQGWGAMQVSGIDVYESILLPAGPTYKKIQTIAFKGVDNGGQMPL
jgi:2'-5' RNA ligase